MKRWTVEDAGYWEDLGPRPREMRSRALTWLGPLAHGLAELAAVVPLPALKECPGFDTVNGQLFQVRNSEVGPLLYNLPLQKEVHR